MDFVIEVLRQHEKHLDNITEKLELLIAKPTSKEIVITALALPDHLRQTLSALFKLGEEGTAYDVSKLTGKSRAVESNYLNQLETMGFVKRQKRGREVIFCLP